MTEPKRANGEGSKPRQRKDGRYYSHYTITVDGVSKRKTVYGRNKTEVRTKLRKALADRDGGVVFDAKNLTLSEFLGRWLEDSVKGSVKIRTYDDYEYVVRCHVVPTLGRAKLKNLTAAHVQALYRKKLDSGLSNETVLHIHRTLRRALNQATRWRLIPFNPVEDTDPPRKVKPKLEVLSTEQVGQFVCTSARKRLFPLYIVAALTGLRAGELLGLKWEDFTSDPGGHALLRIRRRLVNSSRGVEIDEEGTKTGEGRAVGLTKLGEAVLKIHRKRQLEERMRVGAHWTETGLIFTSKRGGYIHPTNVSQYLRRDLEKADLPPIRFHDLRHSFATVLAGAGAHVAIVAGMLGHKDARTTLNTYTHYLPTMQDWAIERLDELFPVALLDGLETSPENVRSRS